MTEHFWVLVLLCPLTRPSARRAIPWSDVVFLPPEARSQPVSPQSHKKGAKPSTPPRAHPDRDEHGRNPTPERLPCHRLPTSHPHGLVCKTPVIPSVPPDSVAPTLHEKNGRGNTFFTERRHSEQSALGLTGSYETGGIAQAEVRKKCANSILVRPVFFANRRFLSIKRFQYEPPLFSQRTQAQRDLSI